MSLFISRRKFTGLLGSATALPLLDHSLIAQKSTPHSSVQARALKFPEGFLWGTAVASYQVEGAVREQGRGASIWDKFAHAQGNVLHDENGDIADDFFHRYRDDIALMRMLGIQAFRFSVAWPRIFPNGSGAVNARGMDFYQRLVDALLEAGIQPYCTLYHWDLPQALQDQGGWENRETAHAFAEYAGYVGGQLSDRVKHFMTVNELRTFIENGNRLGTHAPGLKLSPKRIAQLSHHALLGHGLAVQSLRAATRSHTEIGLADNVLGITPPIDSPSYVAAAQKAMREENAMYLGAILSGQYTPLYLKRLGSDAPVFTAEEMQCIAAPLDFIGLNLYQPFYVRPDEGAAGYALIPLAASHPHMLSPWLTLDPSVMYWAPRLVNDLWHPRALFITENGASSSDQPAIDGKIYDTDRVMYLRNALTHLQRALCEGIPLKGYFLWSFLDNFEWADGYERRFGITYVDFGSEKRSFKLSADYYAEVIRSNAVC